MIDQLTIGSKASYDDFGASVAKRTISQPKKKSIKETIPHSNITYDFSNINGEIYWEERDLEYIFEIMADTPQALESLKTAFATWVMNVSSESIFDPFISDYHFVGTFDSMSYADDDCMEKTTATVSFKAYPYKIANQEKSYKKVVAAGGSETIVAVNNSSHRLFPTITLSGTCSVTFNGITYTIPAGTYTGDSLWLVVGDNAFVFKNPSTTNDCTVTISFYEEVF